jgi:type I restriction enzyme M protein
MDKKFLEALNFTHKEGAAAGIFVKKYPQAEAYSIEVNLEKQIIDYGKLIKADSKTTQNFSMPENFVVLECINRLLEKGYKPENIVLEKTYPAGHGSSPRLDPIHNSLKDNISFISLVDMLTFDRMDFDKNINLTSYAKIKIPIPPKQIQDKMVSEIEALEEKAKIVVISDFNGEVEKILKKYLQ